MSFTRANPSGWTPSGSGSEVTTAQIDALDLDIGNSLDKGPDGDGVFGDLTITGSLKASAGSNVSAGSTCTTASGGRVLLGDGDYPTLKTPYAIARYLPVLFQVNSTNVWNVSRNYSTNDPSTGLLGASGSMDIGSELIDGMTLASIDLYFVVAAHAQVPQALPNVAIDRVAIATGAVTALASTRMPTPVSPNAWYNNSQVQSFNLPIGSTIDRTQYEYFFSFLDESGVGAVLGNQYHLLRLNMTNLVDMRPA